MSDDIQTQPSPDFAEQIADEVRAYFSGGDPLDDGTIVEWVWSEQGNHVLAIYRVPYIDHALGLRIRVYPQLDEEAARICLENLGEPIGSFYDTLEFDSNGVGWWTGDDVEWWYV